MGDKGHAVCQVDDVVVVTKPEKFTDRSETAFRQ